MLPDDHPPIPPYPAGDSGQARDVEDAVASAKRFTDVLSRVPVDLGEALSEKNAQAMREAAAGCERCEMGEACDTWIEEHEEGDPDKTPSFCPSQQLIDSLANKLRS